MSPQEAIEASHRWNPGWHLDQWLGCKDTDGPVELVFRLAEAMSEEQRLTVLVGIILIAMVWMNSDSMKPPASGGTA